MENDQDETGKPKGSGVESGPMAMGMAMAKKMMAQTGQGGSPMEMMQKMMAQMSQGDDKPPMEKMMGIAWACVRRFSTRSARPTLSPSFATPELQHAIADWLKAIEGKAEAVGRQREGSGSARRCAQDQRGECHLHPRPARRAGENHPRGEGTNLSWRSGGIARHVATMTAHLWEESQ